ncbi:MAG: tRNA threonylcarbamoyladenosine dehydratase, partial [Hoylesella buccalis]
KTQMDPLAKVIRKKLRKLGIAHLKVVYSDEEPRKPFPIAPTNEDSSAPIVTNKKRSVPASNAFVPAAAGLIVGGEVVKDLCGL